MSVQGVTDMRGSSSELHQQGEVRRPVDLPPSSSLTPLQNGVSGPVPTTGSVDPTAASPQDDARPDHQQAVATMETAQVREDSVGQDGRDGQTQVLPGGQAVVQEHAQPAGEPAAQQGGVGLRLQQSGSNHLHQGATGVNEVAAVQDDARPSGFPDNINYETPRSQVSRRSMIPSPISAADGPSPSALPRALKWITGIGEYFNIRSVGESFAGPAFAVPLTAVRGRPTTPQYGAVNAASASHPRTDLASGSSSLFNAEALQRLRAMEGSAPLLYSPSDAIVQRGERHSSDSSDLPRDVIQQEVARQLGELTNRVQAAEAENQQLRQRLTFMTEVRQLEEDHAGVILDVLLQEDNLVVLELLRFDQSRNCLALDRITEEPSQTAHVFPQISTRPVPPVSAADPAQRYVAPPQTWNQSPELVSALANSVRQLQELQQSALKGAHATTESSPTSPEAVKPGVTTLSPLPLESEPEAPLLLQDWVHVTGGVAMDLSDSSGEWWGRLVEEIQKAYARWQSASPLDRAAIQPDTARVDLPKWVRVNARFATMLMSVLPAGLKADVISRGCATSSLHILFRMFIAYQPGGGAERTRILQALQDPGQAKTPQEAVTLLRSWNRWLLRCQECRLNPPDTMILSRGLTNLVGPLMATHQDINFRLQCSRSMLHIDRMPTLDETKEYAKHILSEMEIAAAAVNSAGGPKLRALGQATQPNNPPQSLQRQPGTKPICKYFMSDKGCRKGPACAYLHDMSSLDKAQRSRKCLKCGSTEHRQKQCPSVTGKPPAESPGGKAKGGALPKAPQPTSPASSVTPTSPVSPVGLAQITQPVLDSTQLVVNPTAKPTSSSSTQAAASPIAAAVSGPAASGANLAALGLGGQTSGVDLIALDKLLEQAQAQLRAIQPQVGDGSPQAPSPKLNMMTTVVMQEASFQEETESASALLDSGCPQLQEHEALKLITQLEQAKLQKDVTQLEQATADTSTLVEKSRAFGQRTWFHRLIQYARDGSEDSACLALTNASWIDFAPDTLHSNLLPDQSQCKGWQALSGLHCLSRAKRRALRSSKNWIVHMFSGDRGTPSLQLPAGRDSVILNLDLRLSKGFDVRSHPAWNALVWGARNGRISHIVGSPPHTQFLPDASRKLQRDSAFFRHSGSQPLIVEEDPDNAKIFLNELGLAGRMLVLHALACAGRCAHRDKRHQSSDVGFLIEHPKVIDSKAERFQWDSFSFWDTGLWRAYQEEAGLATVDLQTAGGDVGSVHTWTVGTNLGAGYSHQHRKIEHPSVSCLNVDVIGPLRYPGMNPDQRGKAPRPFRYCLVGAYRFAKIPHVQGIATDEEIQRVLEESQKLQSEPAGEQEVVGQDPLQEEGEHTDLDEYVLSEPEVDEDLEQVGVLEEVEAADVGVAEGEHDHELGAEVPPDPLDRVIEDLQFSGESDTLLFAVPLHTNRNAEILTGLQEIAI
ncbi:hypothetical protein AK812_SmicGene23984 [Symbiodinium microadriaticum]|uniref:Uncharacterized protein n=1 Tax=Symbiodinium microadriaticum TaxID=2951 RepID=A0A1Q9DFS1_SYMMI|nr:hypothetical protein AK812_SmicGene23984 [Symbiodinium microadriaticum]